MKSVLELLKQRRFWASLAALVAMVLTMFGYVDFDSDLFADRMVQAIDAVLAVVSMILPLWSYFRPKK